MQSLLLNPIATNNLINSLNYFQTLKLLGKHSLNGLHSNYSLNNKQKRPLSLNNSLKTPNHFFNRNIVESNNDLNETLLKLKLNNHQPNGIIGFQKFNYSISYTPFSEIYHQNKNTILTSLKKCKKEGNRSYYHQKTWTNNNTITPETFLCRKYTNNTNQRNYCNYTLNYSYTKNDGSIPIPYHGILQKKKLFTNSFLGYNQFNLNLSNSINFNIISNGKVVRMYIRESYFNNEKNYGNSKNRKTSYKNTNYRKNTNNKKRNSKRRKNNFFKKFNLTDKGILYSLLGINTLVFAAWQYAIEQAQAYNNGKYLKFMNNHFTVSWHNAFTKKRWWSLLLSAFSHQEKMHFIMNMIVFNSFAPSVIQSIGPHNFLGLYLFSGICSSLSHVSFNHYALPFIKKQQETSFLDHFFTPNPRYTYDQISSLGASGAIMGINTLFACLYPTSIIQMGMFLPLPAWLAMSLYTTLDIYRTATMTNGRIDTAGHVGGALSGLAFYLMKIRPQIQKWNKYY